ncbi:UNVERIFIED_CONTAM: hypothetical protein FKN15_000171 [Acipenser sinensis]
MAVTRRGGSVGVRASLLSEWLRGGSWGDCRPYKLTFLLFPQVCPRMRKKRAEALEKKTAGTEIPERKRK